MTRSFNPKEDFLLWADGQKRDSIDQPPINASRVGIKLLVPLTI